MTANGTRAALRTAAVALAAMVFWGDSITEIDASIAILYLLVPMLVSVEGREGEIRLATGGCMALALLSWILVHGGAPDTGNVLRVLFACVAIGVTGALLVNHQRLVKVREALETSRREMEHFADSVPQILWRSTPDGRIDFFNRAYGDLTGRSIPEAIATQDWTPDLHPEEAAAFLAHTQACFEAGADIRTIYRLRHANGQYRWMLISARPMRDADGRVLAYYGNNTDVHDQVTMQQQVHELNATLEHLVAERTAALTKEQVRNSSLFELSSISFAEMDFGATLPILEDLRRAGVRDLRAYFADHPDELAHCLGLARTTRVNTALARLMGYADLAELAAKPPGENAEDGPDVQLQQLEMIFAGETTLNGHTVLIGKGGLRIPVYFSVSALGDGLHLSSLVDLTERERIEELRRGAQAELARANRIAALGAYSASIAHELNQPVASLLMDARTGLRTLQGGTPNPELAARVLERINQAAQRIAAIITRARDTIVSGDRPAELVDLCALAAELRDLLDRQLRAVRATLEVTCAAGTPPVLADRVNLQQVLVNLVSNAADALRDIGGARRILVSVQAVAEGVEVRVEDTGPGIAEAHRDKLFQPFFTTKAGGIGMGLQICRSIVDGMGGRLEAGNRPEGGAWFRFVLAAADEDSPVSAG
ncbi:PAS domain S-box-containing protein [Sphingomonas sp. NFR04]|uniref:ATP-binding protein n=1 Tax=Sphingomonas sp. NFR04 TaxID=1566283 RepID=UPI0008DFB79F|nr:ATP-binding protein [Sphingomonas sp. NFR04]SFJ13280.1 PAS domain S-box-containing protein [Sphingomonas sp. NFR04]